MRTTLTIDDEVDRRLRKVAKKQNRSYKEVINEALAAGLNRLEVAEPPAAYDVRVGKYGFRSGIDRRKLNQLYDDLEADA